MVLFAAFSSCKERHKTVPLTDTSDYKKGASFLDRLNDSAYFYFNRVTTMSKDSVEIATAYSNIAIIESDVGDYYGGQETLLTSLRYLHEDRERDQYCLVADYNLLGRISGNLKNYDAAIGYYDRALGWAKNSGYRAIILNNMAVAYERKRDYGRAIAIYDSILPKTTTSNKEYARELTNLAMARWKRDSSYKAAPALHFALQLRKSEHDNWGLNSSFAHLADYYTASRPDSALIYAHEMYGVATRLQSPDDQLEALQKLIRLDNPKKAKGYFQQYQQLNDSLEKARSTAKNQFALIRFEVQKSKDENLRLQQDNSLKKIQIYLQWTAITAGSIFVVWLYSWLRRRTRNRIRDNQLRLSKRMHDEVANGIYRVMSAVQHQAITNGQLVDNLEQLYEKSRDISHDQGEIEIQEYDVMIGKLFSDFSGPASIGIVGNEKELWVQVSHRVKDELPHLLQELLVNMDKHSGATRVAVRFQREGGQIVIQYADDGKGLAPDAHTGKGLPNTENRIKTLGGRITFDRNGPNGLKIEIRLPID
jgi:signal transduction histidine kinase